MKKRAYNHLSHLLWPEVLPFFKKAIASNLCPFHNYTVFMKFTTGKLRQASFQIMWCVGMSKPIPLQKSKQFFGWNRQPDKELD